MSGHLFNETSRFKVRLFPVGTRVPKDVGTLDPGRDRDSGNVNGEQIHGKVSQEGVDHRVISLVVLPLVVKNGESRESVCSFPDGKVPTPVSG